MYSGSNKYSGALAGDRAGSGLDAQDALETANAEESVVVPNINAQDDNEDDEPEQVVLSASLDPQFGGLQWNPSENQESKFHEAISTSQMASMLKDEQRNVKYDAALRATIAKFRERNGRAPVVLDIGCGTGLLSMMAARAGAKHVYACEMFESLAHIAQKTVEENFVTKTGVENLFGEPICPVDIFAKKSTELTVDPQDPDDKAAQTNNFDIPQRCDLLVSELLDSALLGEAVLPVIRHAREELLVDDPVMIPQAATVNGTLVNSSLCRSLFDTKDTSCTVRTEEKSLNIPISRRDWFDAMGKGEHEACPVSILMPVHLDSISSHVQPLSAEFECFRVDFQNGRILDNSGQVVPEEGVLIDVCAERSGNADVIALWWELVLSRETPNPVGSGMSQLVEDPLPHIYSTRPICLSGKRSLKSGSKRQRQQELWGWQDHWVQCIHPLVDQVHYISEGSSLRLRCTTTDVKIQLAVENQSSSESSEDLDLIEGNQCVCGLHELNNIERIAMLNSRHYMETVCSTMSKNLREIGQKNSPYRATIDISDGSLCALIVAAYRSIANQSWGDVVTLEDKEMSQMVWTQVARSLSSSLDDEDFLETFMVAENLVETTEMFEDESPAGGEEADTKMVVLTGEAYYYQMSNQQIWMALNYWYRSSAIARTIEYDCLTFPGRALVRVAAVDLEDLYRSHGLVRDVCGFSHGYFDNMQKSWSRKQYHYPLWQYNFSMSSPVVTILEMDFGVQAFKEGNSYFETSRSIPLFPGNSVNAVVMWVDLDMNMRKHNKGGGTCNANARDLHETFESYDACKLATEGVVSGAPLAQLRSESNSKTPDTNAFPWTKQTVLFLDQTKKVDTSAETKQINIKISLDHASGRGVEIETK